MIAASHGPLAVAIACARRRRRRPQQRARDTRATAGTASISGTVFVAGEPKQPARRVRVTLTNVARSSPGQTTTDRRQRRVRLSRPAGGTLRAAGVQERLSQSQLRRVAAGPRRHARSSSRRRDDGEPLDDDRARRRDHRRRARHARPARAGVNVRVLKLGYNAVTGERTLGAPSSAARAIDGRSR
jgi:hypothetical protein